MPDISRADMSNDNLALGALALTDRPFDTASQLRGFAALRRLEFANFGQRAGRGFCLAGWLGERIRDGN